MECDCNRSVLWFGVGVFLKVQWAAGPDVWKRGGELNTDSWKDFIRIRDLPDSSLTVPADSSKVVHFVALVAGFNPCWAGSGTFPVSVDFATTIRSRTLLRSARGIWLRLRNLTVWGCCGFLRWYMESLTAWTSLGLPSLIWSHTAASKGSVCLIMSSNFLKLFASARISVWRISSEGPLMNELVSDICIRNVLFTIRGRKGKFGLDYRFSCIMLRRFILCTGLDFSVTVR